MSGWSVVADGAIRRGEPVPCPDGSAEMPTLASRPSRETQRSGCYAVGVDVTVLGGEPVARSVQCGGYGDDR